MLLYVSGPDAGGLRAEREGTETMRRTLGKEHPNTLMLMRDLAIRYGELGRREEAVNCKREIRDNQGSPEAC